MANILGLINSESGQARFETHRQKVFYFFPNGAAPLLGLLSLMKDEACDDPTFNWNEKRLSENWTTAANISTTVVFYATGVTIASGKVATATVAGSNITFTTGTQYAIKTAANPEQKFRIGHIIRFVAVNTSVADEEVIGRVNAVNTASDSIANTLGFICLKTVGTAVDYDYSTHAGKQVAVIGSAFAEGIRDESSGIYNTPVTPSNYTQIFRKPVTISGTALKTSTKFDERGVFPDQSKEAAVDFMRELEYGFIFGTKAQTGSATTSITRTTGGILYFLQLWEAGSTYGNTAATADTDDTKRIISNSAATVSLTQFEGWLERAFRISNNKTNEKLALIGSGALMTLNRLVRNSVMSISEVPLGDSFGMDLRKLITPQGTLYLRSHPLFSFNSVLRYNMLIVDVPNLMYRYLRGRDMELLTNRQENDADYRKDEWLGECGLELQMPESHLYIQNLTTAV